jgi:hypothetical protein
MSGIGETFLLATKKQLCNSDMVETLLAKGKGSIDLNKLMMEGFVREVK